MRPAGGFGEPETTGECARGEIAALAEEAGATIVAVPGLPHEEIFGPDNGRGALMMLPDDAAPDEERCVAHLLMRQLVARLGRREVLALLRRVCERAPVAALLAATLAAAALDPLDGILGQMYALWPR